jgi:hypothetical protein
MTGNRRLKNEGRADHAKGSAKNAVDKVAHTLTGRKRTKRGTDARTNPTETWEVAMLTILLTILLIIVVILLLTDGGFGLHRRGRRGT